MTGLAQFALKGVVQAGGMSAVFLVLSVLFPPLAWLSGAIVGLVALRWNSQQALQTVGLAVVIAAGLFCVTIGSLCCDDEIL